VSDKPIGYVTADEFIEGVVSVANDAGYGWLADGRHHPEDIAANLGPLIAAYAAGMAAVIHAQAKAGRAGWKDKA
jgi:hypothetical protein